MEHSSKAGNSHISSGHAGMHHYRRFGIMILLSFIAMYILMYAMVDTLGNALPNFNQAYMAGLMVAPMVIIELVLMADMYRNKRLNMLFLAGAVVAGLAFFLLIRWQGAIGDRQFLRSMVPHHAGAILMCQEASIRRPEIERLCGDIVTSQRAEIAQMKAMLREQD